MIRGDEQEKEEGCINFGGAARRPALLARERSEQIKKAVPAQYLNAGSGHSEGQMLVTPMPPKYEKKESNG